LVAVSGVVQDPSTYSVSGTTLTFSGAPPSGSSNISVRFLGIPASGVATTAYRTVTEFTATSGQTTFSVPSYTVGYIDVYRNGVLLGSADYTATSGTTVVLNNGCTAGDLVETISFFVSSVLNAIPAVANAVTTSYINNGAVTRAKMAASGAWAPAGTVIQVAQATFTGTQTISASGNMNWTDISSLSVTITPTSSASRFLLIAQVSCAVLTIDRIVALRFTGGNAGNFVGDAAGIRARAGTFFTTPSTIGYGINSSLMMNYLDSPATGSAVTYKVQAAPNFNSGNVAINYNAGSDNDNAFIPRAACSLIVMEIAG